MAEKRRPTGYGSKRGAHSGGASSRPLSYAAQNGPSSTKPPVSRRNAAPRHGSPRVQGSTRSVAAAASHPVADVRTRHASAQQMAMRQQVAQYSRHANPDYRSRKRKKPVWKKALVAVGALVLFLVLAVGAYGLWFSDALNKAFSMGDQIDAAVNDVLVSPVAGEPFYMLLLGSDSREGSETSGNAAESGDNQRSDVMILVRVDASSKLVTMVSIPRDTPLTLEDGSIVKINEAYNIGGAAYSIKAVSDLTGVPISHYAEVHFSEFQELVDKLGGVEVDVPVELSYKDALTGDWVTLEPGVQTIDGQQAQIFARARHEYETDQDAHRQNNIRTLLEAIITKVLEKPFYELPNTVLDLAGSVGTDLNAADLVTLATEYAGGSGGMAMYSCTGPSDGDINPDANSIWLCYENPEGWANLMAVVDAGDDPSGLDVNSTAIIPEAD